VKIVVLIGIGVTISVVIGLIVVAYVSEENRREKIDSLNQEMLLKVNECEKIEMSLGCSW